MPISHVFCNNAGGANGSRQVTAEGFERTFVTDEAARRLWEVSEDLVKPYLDQGAESAVERPLE